MVTSVCSKMLFLQTMHSRSLAGKCRMAYYSQWIVWPACCSSSSSQEYSHPWRLPYMWCPWSHMTPWGGSWYVSFASARPWSGLSFGTLSSYIRPLVCRSQNFLLLRAMFNLLRKGLGRSKPATHPGSKHKQHVYGDCTISKLPELSSIEQNKHYKRERVRLFILDYVQFA